MLQLSLCIAAGIILGEFGNRLLTYFFSRLERRRLMRLQQAAYRDNLAAQGQTQAQQQLSSIGIDISGVRRH